MGMKEDLAKKYREASGRARDKYKKSEGALITGALLGAAANGAAEGKGLGFAFGKLKDGTPRVLGYGAIAGPVLLLTKGLGQGSFVQGLGLGATCAQISDRVEEMVAAMSGVNKAMDAERRALLEEAFNAGAGQGQAHDAEAQVLREAGLGK
jgi:hypothetical protein